MKLFEDIKCMLTVDKNIYLWNAVLLIYHLVHAIKKKKAGKSYFITCLHRAPEFSSLMYLARNWYQIVFKKLVKVLCEAGETVNKL